MFKHKYSALIAMVLAVLLLGGCAGSGAPVSETLAASVPAPPYEVTEEAAGADSYFTESAQQDILPVDGDESWRYAEIEGDEEYDNAEESPFKSVATSPLSTFSSDVDTASYSNMRRFINYGQKPEGVRIEELINYFDYDYERPGEDSEHPFSITTEVAPCPWNAGHYLAMIGVQGVELQNTEDVANNIVFLLDVSGSMSNPDKLPLLQQSFNLLIEQLGKNDVISIVTYAGSDQIVADSVPGDRHRELQRAINSLSAGGSTAGAQGLKTAYELAEKNYIEGGNNRVILATDGDFNVGQSSLEALQTQIEEAREGGVFITVLGFGMGNLKDNMMEMIADHGNGNYAYIDNLGEARKVLVDEFDSTMHTIAKDVKFQVEFNPEIVGQYRLIGYNNRRLNDEDFNDDKKDAGDIGSGHSVTVFYELIPAGDEGVADVDDLQYQQSQTTGSHDFMVVKLRYKAPDGNESQLVQQVVGREQYTEKPSQAFGFASAVAEYGLILTDSQYKAQSSLGAVEQRAEQCLGNDPYGLREEFIELVGEYRRIAD